MPSQWDHKADKDLLLTIIEDGNLTHISWQSIAAKMEAKQYTFSHEACRQHYQKIRRESRNGSGGISTPSKSSSSAAANNKPTTPASKQRTQNAASSSSATSALDGDDEEDFPTPSAKRKRVAKKDDSKEGSVGDLGGFAGQTAAQFKVEEFADDGSGGYGRTVVDLVDDGIYAV